MRLAYSSWRREHIYSPIILQYKTVTRRLNKCHATQKNVDSQIKQEIKN